MAADVCTKYIHSRLRVTEFEKPYLGLAFKKENVGSNFIEMLLNHHLKGIVDDVVNKLTQKALKTI